MAQTEDTELRDLVIEALEKNGSLAKIRALLRANIFLAFEDECENVRQNVSLDNLLKLPEGVLALSIVHEFLESCNLKNTLFVYKSESRQGKDYNYHEKKLADKLCLGKQDNAREPVLVTLIRNLSKSKNGSKQGDQRLMNKHGDSGDNNNKDEQNSSYIVHEDSQSNATNTSQSDNSLDEKNKLHLRLQLDNSDTDTSTSTDSTRDKSSSEYIPSDHVLEASNSHNIPESFASKSNEKNTSQKQENTTPYFSKLSGNNSSDSTSYVDLKPFSSFDEKALNTMGLPYTETVDVPQLQHVSNIQDELQPQDSGKTPTLSSVSSLSFKNESIKNDFKLKSPHGSSKSDGETAEYTYDFTTSQGSKNRGSSDKLKSPKHITDAEYKTSLTSPHTNSHSSVSISDVADLISEKSSSFNQYSNSEKFLDQGKSMLSSNNSKKSGEFLNKHSDDSGDFTESPIPSLSNLSLNIHSD